MSAGKKKVLVKREHLFVFCCHECEICNMYDDHSCSMGFEHVSKETVKQLYNLKSMLENETP